ncbi:MAG TPA: hypothetical protein VGM02_02940 [Acidobacteriaceae bacterium]|jgi:hypothetical protein
MKTLKSYLFWTYQRGSFHYDVMVTLILLFLFVSPRFINFHDRPEETSSRGHGVLVHAGPNGKFTFEVGADQVHETSDANKLRAELESSIAPVAGAVSIDRWQAQKDSSGRVESYKVWARR